MQRTIRLLFIAALAVSGVAASVSHAHSAPAAPVRPPAPAAFVPEPAITTTGPGGDYIRAVHSRLHGRWTQDFLRTVSATHPATHPLNVTSHQATLAMAIRWDGTIAEIAVKRSSGSPEFDRAVMDVARKSAPFPLPVTDVISDDSYAHMEWTFARDHRGCSAGAEILRVDDPLEVSLPRLISSNRIGEALRRVGQAPADGEAAALDRFARLYLGRSIPDPVLNVAASVALAESGDKSQTTRLRAAMSSRPTVELAARGLRKLGVDICEVVREPMETGTAQARDIAIGAARGVAAGGGDIASCRPSLAAVVADTHQPTALRLQALDTLVTFVPTAARPVVMATLEDKDPAVRGAALLASVRKGAGRPEMYRLAPLLHDKSVEVRGAASAGMVRAGGDSALEQLYLLARETDARPGTWVAAELAQLSTPASAEFLGKMVKKNNPPVQAAAARALAARKDASARKELDDAKADERLPRDVRAIAAGESKPAAPPVATAPSEANAATAPVHQMLKSAQNREAAGWIVERLAGLETRDAIDVLGAWLVRQPTAAAVTPSAAPAETALPYATPTTASNAPER